MGQAAQVSCTATIFYMHTPAYVALISTQICPIFILMKVYCMCAYNIWCHKNGLRRRTSPRPSKALKGPYICWHVRQHQWVTCILMNFFLLCASPFGAGMPNPGERLGFNLVCKKCSPQIYKRGGGEIRVGGSCPKYPPPRFPPFFPVFPPFFPRFSLFFLRFSPFFPVFPRFSPFFPATGNQTPIGYGNLGPLGWGWRWGMGMPLGQRRGQSLGREGVNPPFKRFPGDPPVRRAQGMGHGDGGDAGAGAGHGLH